MGHSLWDGEADVQFETMASILTDDDKVCDKNTRIHNMDFIQWYGMEFHSSSLNECMNKCVLHKSNNCAAISFDANALKLGPTSYNGDTNNDNDITTPDDPYSKAGCFLFDQMPTRSNIQRQQHGWTSCYKGALYNNALGYLFKCPDIWRLVEQESENIRTGIT
jgi:hypothetical protein